MEVIRLLRHRWELRGTLYIEFQPGVFVGRHWEPGSVYVREEFRADLEAAVARHAPGCSRYAMTPVAAPAWAGVLPDFDALSAGLRAATDRPAAAARLPYLFGWYGPLAGNHWRRPVLQYAALARELSGWVRGQLPGHGAVSVLGI